MDFHFFHFGKFTVQFSADCPKGQAKLYPMRGQQLRPILLSVNFVRKMVYL